MPRAAIQFPAPTSQRPMVCSPGPWVPVPETSETAEEHEKKETTESADKNDLSTSDNQTSSKEETEKQETEKQKTEKQETEKQETEKEGIEKEDIEKEEKVVEDMCRIINAAPDSSPKFKLDLEEADRIDDLTIYASQGVGDAGR